VRKFLFRFAADAAILAIPAAILAATEAFDDQACFAESSVDWAVAVADLLAAQAAAVLAAPAVAAPVTQDATAAADAKPFGFLFESVPSTVGWRDIRTGTTGEPSRQLSSES
jgi:hypothetical protein